MRLGHPPWRATPAGKPEAPLPRLGPQPQHRRINATRQQHVLACQPAVVLAVNPALRDVGIQQCLEKPAPPRQKLAASVG